MEYPVQHAPRQATEHAAGHEAAGHDAGGQQHPIGLYLKVWGYLFLLSAMSYLVDYFQVQGVLRWSLIIIFMLLKAGLIVSIFMHLAWERSEEHTSELQSLMRISYAVFRLKKRRHNINNCDCVKK